MDVQTVTGAAAGTTTDTGTGTGTGPKQTNMLDYDAFLQLLIAQMKNQDPTDPIDPTTQLAQLASFSQVEQAIQTNARLDAMLTSSVLAQADGMIGRTITSADGSISGEVVAIAADSGGGAAILADGQRVPIEAGVEIS